MYSSANDQIWEFLGGWNCMKKILTAGNVGSRNIQVYIKTNIFPHFPLFLKGERKRAFTGLNLGFNFILWNILWGHRAELMKGFDWLVSGSFSELFSKCVFTSILPNSLLCHNSNCHPCHAEIKCEITATRFYDDVMYSLFNFRTVDNPPSKTNVQE